MSALGGLATLRAATRVNPEQAPKVKLSASTRLSNGEDRRAADKKPSSASAAVDRGSGSSTQGRSFG
jgi:hypothetical protein